MLHMHLRMRHATVQVGRQQRRQELDAAARQLPIRMAIPLVACVLPSFVLLGVVPLFVGSLGGLGAHM